MRRLRRLTAALSGAFLLQLTLLASGTLCPMNHSSESMPGMSHAAPVGASVAWIAQHEGPGLTAPATCDSMASCTVPVSAPAAVLASAATPQTGAELDEPVVVHVGPAFAPELPPPRA